MTGSSSPSPAAPTPYELIGGEAGVRRLIDRFYDIMDTAPEAATIRALHAKSLKASREKLFLFFTGWTGGPQLYVEKFGHPRLRMRHFPFSIGAKERDEWLWCMDRALDEQEMPDYVRAHLRQRLHQLADHVRNREE
jgi:hemoglobin